MLISSIILALVVGFGLGDDTDSPEDEVYRLGLANNYFAATLYRKLSEVIEGNIFFSPLATSSMLTMLYWGAEGQTARELGAVLGYKGLGDTEVLPILKYYLSEVISKIDPNVYRIDCISAMIVDDSLPVFPKYKLEMRDMFQAYVEEANVAEERAVVVDRMNTWAKIKTKGSICSLAESIDPETTLFLASAAYFKGAWKMKFDPEDTKDHPFFNGGLRPNATEVPMMHAHAYVRYFEDEDEDFTAIELYYEGRNISMVIFLPKAIDGLTELEWRMTSARMAYYRREMYYRKVHITMPKFKLETDINLARALKDLGLTRVFKLGAELPGIVPEGVSVILDEVKHKAAVEVNENGTIAAAITRAIMTKSIRIPLPDPEFTMDHPFIFTIVDVRVNLILFMGRITNFVK